ncbi:hypothetical protein MRBLBA21_004259 [Peribacillus frigoritolerans]
MGKDKVNIACRRRDGLYGLQSSEFDPSAKMKNSVSSYYIVFCILSGTRRDLKS